MLGKELAFELGVWVVAAVFLFFAVWAVTKAITFLSDRYEARHDPPLHKQLHEYARREEVKAVEDRVNGFERKLDEGFREVERSGKVSRAELYKTINASREDVAAIREKTDSTEKHLYRLETKLDRLIERKA